MFKITFVLCFVLAVAQAGYLQGSVEHPSTDFFDNLKRNYYSEIEELETDIQIFNRSLGRRLEEVSYFIDVTVEKVVETKTKITSWELISKVDSQYIDIQVPKGVRVQFAKCSAAVKIGDDAFYRSAKSIIDSLNNYYEVNFTREINECSKFHYVDVKYNGCVLKAITNADKYASQKKKEFNELLAAVKCTTQVNLKKIVDCTLNIFYDISLKIIDITNSIHNEISPKKICGDCQYCPNYTPINEDALYHKTIENPFQYHGPELQCTILNVTRGISHVSKYIDINNTVAE